MTAPTHCSLPIDEILFDVTNPRITHLLEIYTEDSLSVEQIALSLQPSDASYINLQEAIRSHKGLINPIKINKTAANQIVFEGNTRLAIYRKFHLDGEPGDWSRIPCVVYQELSDVEVHNLRLQDHMIGTREWTPYAKAKYLYFLHHEEDIPLEDLVAFCGGDTRDVLRRIETYRTMEGPYRETLAAEDEYDEDLDFNPGVYSVFDQFQRPTIQHAIRDQGFDEYDFSKWVAEKKFKEQRDARNLPEIMKDEQARALFLKEGSYAAIRYLGVDVAEVLNDATIPVLCRALIGSVSNNVTTSDISLLRNSPDDVDAIKDCVRDLSNFIDEWLHENNEDTH